MNVAHDPLSGPDARAIALENWLDTGFGRHALAAERALVGKVLPGIFGFHLMQLGISRHVTLFEASAVRHKFQLAQYPGVAGVSALAAPEQLPIDNEAVDVVLLHHALEYSVNPHQLLREAARVVVPHGHLLVLGFNPWSLFGVRALAGRHLRGHHPIWSSRLLAARRLTDWLELLDFAVDSIQYRVIAPPVHHAGMLQRLAPLERIAADWSFPGGAVYLIHARKQLARLTPVRNIRWRAPRLGAVSLAAPRARDTTLH
jgi:SAM-dependent methyltransferase